MKAMWLGLGSGTNKLWGWRWCLWGIITMCFPFKWLFLMRKWCSKRSQGPVPTGWFETKGTSCSKLDFTVGSCLWYYMCFTCMYIYICVYHIDWKLGCRSSRMNQMTIIEHTRRLNKTWIEVVLSLWLACLTNNLRSSLSDRWLSYRCCRVGLDFPSENGGWKQFSNLGQYVGHIIWS